MKIKIVSFEIGDIVVSTNPPGVYEIIGIVDEDIWHPKAENGLNLMASKGDYKVRLRDSLNASYTYASASSLTRKY